jgi:hypothetical protein
MRDSLRKQDKTNAKRETETLEMTAAPRNRRGHLQLRKPHGRWQRMTAPLRDLPMENADNGSEGNSTKRTDKSKAPPIVLTSEANLNTSGALQPKPR